MILQLLNSKTSLSDNIGSAIWLLYLKFDRSVDHYLNLINLNFVFNADKYKPFSKALFLGLKDQGYPNAKANSSGLTSMDGKFMSGKLGFELESNGCYIHFDRIIQVFFRNQ